MAVSTEPQQIQSAPEYTLHGLALRPFTANEYYRMADMGMLLVAIMLINMVLSLVVLPLLVWFVKPKFLAREDLMVGENVDISQFMVKEAAA